MHIDILRFYGRCVNRIKKIQNETLQTASTTGEPGRQLNATKWRYDRSRNNRAKVRATRTNF